MPVRLLVFSILIVAGLCGIAQAETLASVKARGTVRCGVADAAPGFSATEANGSWTGLGADYCRGLAATIFNDPGKAEFVPLQPDERIAALLSGKVDTFADLIPWTLHADTDEGVKFVATMFYDGQTFMVTKASGLKSARDLAGKPVCVEARSEAEPEASEYFDANNIRAKLVPITGREALAASYIDGTCAAISAATSILAGMRETLPTPADNVLLPDVITKRPLAVVVAQGDDRWFDVARWTFFALLDGEELGVTQTNVDEMLGSDNISVRRFLGVEGDFGASIGLNKDWAYQLIKGVGNYADVYGRDVGDETPLKLPRGLNALWNKGGIQYAPPVR